MWLKQFSEMVACILPKGETEPCAFFRVVLLCRPRCLGGGAAFAEPQLKNDGVHFWFLHRTSFILLGRGVHKDKRARLITPLYLLPTTQ